MSSLHSALETWTAVANRSVQEGTGRKIKFESLLCNLVVYDACLLGQR